KRDRQDLPVHLPGTGLKAPPDFPDRLRTTLLLRAYPQGRSPEPGSRDFEAGRGPTGVAAAAIYISSILGGERRTQREVAEVAGVTEVTIRNRYKELAEKLDIEIIL